MRGTVKGSERDWESGAGLLGIDDPAEWDAVNGISVRR